jgi:hypothetical protein
MLPSMHARWSQDSVGGPAANTGSPFAPMADRPGVQAVTPQRTAPILPSRQGLSNGGAPPAMTPTPQAAPPMQMQNRLMARMV